MNGWIIGLIVILVLLGIIGLSSMTGQHGYGGGSKNFVGGAKKNLGIIGLLIILLGSLTVTSCIDL